jgi:hypothetical protein
MDKTYRGDGSSGTLTPETLEMIRNGKQKRAEIASLVGLPDEWDLDDLLTSILSARHLHNSSVRERLCESWGMPTDTSWDAIEATGKMFVRNTKASQVELDQSDANFDALTNRYQELAEEHESTKRSLRRALDSVVNLSQICLSDRDG